MRKDYGMPGPGGSTGKCAICGKPFIVEILLGKAVKSFSVAGCSAQMFGHDDCLKTLKKIKGDWQKLSEGPLKEAYREANNKGKRD